jgi:hypothetical protein
MPLYQVPEDMGLKLRWFSCRNLKINSKVGTELIIEAYNEYYDIGAKCLICKRVFSPKRTGRKAKYCSDACKQKAFRRRR